MVVDASRKIKSRRGEGHLRNDDWIVEMPLAVEIRTRYVEQMNVHSNQAWNYRVTVEIPNTVASAVAVTSEPFWMPAIFPASMMTF